MSKRESALLIETKQLAALYGVKPDKRLGQNFLVDEMVYVRMIEAADLQNSDRVLEIGPGLGFLTLSLADAVQEIMTVELDKRIAAFLPDRFKTFGHKNIQVIRANILDFAEIPELRAFLEQPYKIVANLPYNITSVFLRKFLTADHPPVSLTLLLQKEVAQRLTAKPGALSLLGLSAQFYATVDYCFTVDRQSFWPSPAVDSAVVSLRLKDQPPLNPVDSKAFWRLTHIGFAAKRKMLKKNLAAALELESEDFGRLLSGIGLDERVRAQDLSLADWLKLFALLKRDVL